MSDINLLPQNLREREKKERRKTARRSYRDNVELAIPKRDAQVNLKSDKPKKSFWSRILGNKKKEVKKPVEIKKDNFDLPVARKSLLPTGSMVTTSSISKSNIKKLPRKNKRFKRGIKKGTENNLKFQDIKFNSKDEALKLARGDSWQKIFKSVIRPGKAKVLPPKAPKPVLISKKSPQPMGFIKSRYHLAPKYERGPILINLIPKELISSQRITKRMMIISVLLAVIIPVLVIFSVYYLIDQYQEKVDQQIIKEQNHSRQLQEEIVNLSDAKNEKLFFQQRIMFLSDILENHIYWTNFFALLEKYTLDSVYFTGFSANTSGELVLQATVQNYVEVARQIAVFEEASDFIEKVEVDKVSFHNTNVDNINRVDIIFKLKVKDGVFTKNN